MDSRRYFRLVLATLALSLCACPSAVRTYEHWDKQAKRPFCVGCKTSDHGVSYFLPTNLVRIVFTNQTIVSEIKAAAGRLKKNQKAIQDTEAEIGDIEEVLRKLGPGPEREKYKEELKAKKKELADLKKKTKGLEDALAKAQTAREQILVEVQPTIPDTTRLYVADLKHRPWHNDKVTIKTSADGLLTHVSLSSEDRSQQILENIVSTAIEAAKIYARLHGFPVRTTPTPQDFDPAEKCRKAESPDEAYYWEFTIDPSDPREVAKVNLQLLATPLPLLVNIRRAPAGLGANSNDQCDSKFESACKRGRSVNGIYYRRPVPYVIEVLEDPERKHDLCQRVYKTASAGGGPTDDSDDTSEADHADAAADTETAENAGNADDAAGDVSPAAANMLGTLDTFFRGDERRVWPTNVSTQVVMAAGGPIAWLDLEARPFVTTDISANFKHGQLVEATAARPSELEGASQIPLELVKMVGAAVGDVLDNVIPVKVEWTNNAKSLVDAQTELISARQGKAEAEESLRDFLEEEDQEDGATEE